MKLKHVALLAFAFPLLANAGWNVVNHYEVDTMDPNTIGWSFDHFKGFQQLLSGFELSRPSKMVVRHVAGQVNLMKWENDLGCQVPDPAKVKIQTVTQVDVEYYWVDQPDTVQVAFSHEYLSAPCQLKASELKKSDVRLY